MSFVTTQPEALTYAAGKLESLGSSMAAESAAAAAPTTGVIPAAAEEVSALQAAIFGAYGSLYQSINAQAASDSRAFCSNLGDQRRVVCRNRISQLCDHCVAHVGTDLGSAQFCRQRGQRGEHCHAR